MAGSDAYKDLPPKMKRFAKANLWAFTGALVASGFIRPWLGFWPTTILLALVLLGVVVPFGITARRERKELDSQRDPDN
ncbi:hypothetical protein [Arthrobacter sp. AG258]|uniref:hypothetical protein n=1 Tax=Arthrobacter sp. AG258 TaxID=2183899 RepID=UPI00105C751B|nr:hypothetical protein [Arthrobacter sp. AG258]